MSENKLKPIHIKVTFEWDYYPEKVNYPRGTTDNDVLKIEEFCFNNDAIMYIDACPNDPVIEITTVNEKE
jgi:hypothetical protein